MSGRGPRRDPVKERFWRRVVRQQVAGRLSVREVCERRGLAESAFYAWRREIRRRDQQEGRDTARAHRRQSTALAGTSGPAGPASKRGRPAQPRFLPVSVANVAPPAAVEIHLPSGIVLRIGRDCDLAALRAVLGAVLDGQVEAAAC
jgi:hypothetical protein